LRIEEVSKVFERDGKSISVLEDINLEVADGEFVCLVGPSGCGKSTLLNLMGGFLSPTRGSIAIDGEAVTTVDDLHRALTRWSAGEVELSMLRRTERTQVRVLPRAS